MKKLIFLCICVGFSFSAFSQSADVITELLQTKELTNEQTAYILATWQDDANSEKTYTQAFTLLQEEKFFSSSKEASSPITLAELSIVCMRIFDMKGGLLYTLFPSERYAFRELKFLNILPQTANPSFNVSGKEAFNILSKLENKAISTGKR